MTPRLSPVSVSIMCCVVLVSCFQHSAAFTPSLKLAGPAQRSDDYVAVRLSSSSSSSTEAPTAPIKLPRNTMPLVTEINSEKELKQYLVQDDRITVIKFHASWCKTCQKFGLLFKKLARDKADWAAGKKNKPVVVVKKGSARLASVEWAANTDLCRSMGVKRLPSVHFYKNGQKLIGFPAGPSKFKVVKDYLAYYESLSQVELQFEMDLEAGKSLVEDVVLQASDSSSSSAIIDDTLAKGSALIEDALLHGPQHGAVSMQVAAKSGGKPRRHKLLWQRIWPRNRQ